LPRAKNKVAAAYIKDRKKMQDREQRGKKKHWSMYKITAHPLMDSGAITDGESGQEVKQKIILRVPQKEDETTMCIF
jgi:hypothetical protein